MENKMRRTSDPKLVAVINDWLSGLDYRTIGSRRNVSIATVSDIVNNFCQQHPSVAALRELNLETARTGIPVEKAREAISSLDTLKSSGLSVSDADRCAKFLNKYAPHEKVALEAGIRIWNLEHETGKTYDAIVRAANAATSEKAKAEQRKQQLETEIEEYSGILPQYKRLSALDAKLTNHRIGIPELDSFIDFHLRLQHLKFDMATAEHLATALANGGLTPQEGSQELTRLLLKGRNLLNSISALEQSANEATSNYNQKLREYAQYYNQQTGSMQRALSVLNSEVEARKRALKEKEQELAGINEKIAERGRFYETERERLETEKKGIEDEIDTKRSELSSLQDNLRQTKDELAGIDSLIKEKEKLALLASFLEKPDLPLEKEALLELTQLIVERLKPHYANYHPEFRRSMINSDLASLGRSIKEELKFERAVHAG